MDFYFYLFVYAYLQSGIVGEGVMQCLSTHTHTHTHTQTLTVTCMCYVCVSVCTRTHTHSHVWDEERKSTEEEYRKRLTDVEKERVVEKLTYE